MKRRVARGALVGLVAGVGAAVVTELVKPRGGTGRLLDWEEIRRLAERRAGTEPELTVERRRKLATHYRKLAAGVQDELLEAVGGLPQGAELPPFDALGRRAWIDLNVEILRRGMDPLLEMGLVPDNRLVDLGRAGLNRYVAYLLAFLGHRVLGQFDPQLLGKEPVGPARSGLYLVEPNIVSWEEEAGLPPDDLRRWLILHEMTHAWQFAAHPWLREHLNGLLAELLETAGRAAQSPLQRAFQLTLGVPGQMAMIRRMQATMSLVEGYSNLVMNQVGRRLLPEFDRLQAAHRERSRRRSPLELLFWRVTGLELKLQQYERGEAFCRAIHDAHGMAVLNLAWTDEEHLPRLDEIANPSAWYRRIATAVA
jgi:coenzyme F420 biosynthesis associated uncharacterized protein